MSEEIKPFKDAKEAEGAHDVAQKRISEMCDAAWNGRPPWTMSIPARETDADLFFSRLLRQDLATIRAQEAMCNALDVANKDLHELVAKHEAEIARLRQENTDYAQDAKDTLPLYDKIDQLTAALAKALCERAIEGMMQIAALHGLDYTKHACGQCVPCNARAAQPKEKNDAH